MTSVIVCYMSSQPHTIFEPEPLVTAHTVIAMLSLLYLKKSLNYFLNRFSSVGHIYSQHGPLNHQRCKYCKQKTLIFKNKN